MAGIVKADWVELLSWQDKVDQYAYVLVGAASTTTFSLTEMRLC